MGGVAGGDVRHDPCCKPIKQLRSELELHMIALISICSSVIIPHFDPPFTHLHTLGDCRNASSKHRQSLMSNACPNMSYRKIANIMRAETTLQARLPPYPGKPDDSQARKNLFMLIHHFKACRYRKRPHWCFHVRTCQ